MKENNINKKNKIIPKYFYLSFFIIIYFEIIIVKSIDCPRNAPILSPEGCKMQYCSKNQFDSGKCIINNTIIKTQWLNNIIKIGGLKYRYVNIASYSNGDMVVETTCYEGEPKRYFYGLKKNGRAFFKDKNNKKETPYYMKETNEQGTSHKGKFEAEAIVIKSSESGEGNGKEYFFSASKLECYAEIFDFENDKIYYKTVNDFTSYNNIKTLRHSLFSFTNYNTNYYYFFGFTSDNTPI